jgi:hypothetical protein
VKRLTTLVTPDGKWVFPNTDEFFAALGDPAAPDYDGEAFAVKNLGFIKLQVIQDSLIEIDLHPRNVELPALLAAQQQLLMATVKLFRIKYFDTTWHSEISSSAEHTIERLSELCAPVYTEPQSNRFIVERQRFGKLFEEESQLVPLAQKWRASFGLFDSSIISLAMRHQLLSRLMIVGVKPRDPEPVFRFLGDGHRWLGGDNHHMFVGQKIVDQPDREYGEWVAEFYKSVATSGQPRYDLVTAWLRYEDQEGSPQRLIQYQRLLLPWKTPSGEVLVTLCSEKLDKDTARPAALPGSSSSIKLVRSS